MALPQLNTARFGTTIPSTKQEITFRPYVVGEEKVLMMAMESKDTKQMMRALKDILGACIFDNIDIDSLASFDIEWLFLQLRSKSVGEGIEVKLKCDDEDCTGVTDIAIDIDDIKMQDEKPDNNIQLTPEVGVVLRYPSVKELENYSQENLETLDGAFKFICDCLDQIYDNDDVFQMADTPRAEIEEFVNNLNSDQFKLITTWLTKLPAVVHNIEYDCVVCKKQNTVELRGLQSFFT